MRGIKKCCFTCKQKKECVGFKKQLQNEEAIFFLGILCLIASAAMYFMGKSNSNLTELMDFWWIPLPLGAIFLLVSNKKKA